METQSVKRPEVQERGVIGQMIAEQSVYRPSRRVYIEAEERGRPGRYRMMALLLASALALIIAGVWLWSRPPLLQDKLWTGTVEAGELRVGIGGHGKLVPSGLLTLASATGGTVAVIHALPGAKVQKGDAIVTLRNLDVLQQLNAAEKAYSDKLGDQATAQSEIASKRIQFQAALGNARDALSMADIEMKTESSLAKSGVVAQIQVEKKRMKLSSAQRQLTQAEASLKSFEVASKVRLKLQATAVAVSKSQLERLKSQADDLVLRAPQTGVVYELMDGITVGSTVNVGTLIAKISTQSNLSAELQIPAAHASELALGQPVELRVDEKPVAGRVERIDPLVRQDEVAVSVGLDPGMTGGLFAGQPVSGEVIVDKLENTVYVPRPAGVLDGAPAEIFVLNRANHRLSRRLVKFGRSEGRFIVVESGLSKGDEIVLSDMDRMKRYNQIRFDQN